jgi:hypothetical protein
LRLLVQLNLHRKVKSKESIYLQREKKFGLLYGQPIIQSYVPLWKKTDSMS